MHISYVYIKQVLITYVNLSISLIEMLMDMLMDKAQLSTKPLLREIYSFSRHIYKIGCPTAKKIPSV